MDIHMDMTPAQFGAIKTLARREGLTWKDHYSTTTEKPILMFSTIKSDIGVIYIHKLATKDMHRKVAIHNEDYSKTLFRVSGKE